MQEDVTLTDSLMEYWQSHHFASSWIIETNNMPAAIEEVTRFIKQALAVKSVEFNLSDYPDTRHVSVDDKHKYISVDQVKKLQYFISNSAMVGQHKFAIIESAQLLTNNAANSCLKLLEDTPKNSYIFLLINAGSELLPTLMSRSYKLKHHSVVQQSEVEPTESLCKTRLEFVQQITGKIDKEKLITMAETYLTSLRAIMMHYLSSQHLILEDRQFADAIGVSNASTAAVKLEQLQKQLDDFLKYDLDARACLILMSDVIYGRSK